MDLLPAQRGILKQAFAQVGKVPIRVSGGGRTLIGLTYMHIPPGDIFGSPSAEAKV